MRVQERAAHTARRYSGHIYRAAAEIKEKLILSSCSRVFLLNAAWPCAEDAAGLCQDVSCEENGMFLFFKGFWFMCVTSDSIAYS